MGSRREAGAGREAVISVRLSPREEEAIRKAATERGEPVSAFVRRAALGVARPSKKSGPSWSTSTTTVAPGGTVVPRYTGTIASSQPAPSRGTAGTAPAADWSR